MKLFITCHFLEPYLLSIPGHRCFRNGLLFIPAGSMADTIMTVWEGFGRGGRWSTTVLIIWYSRQTSLFRLWKGINDALTTAQRWLSSGSGHPLFHNFTFTETQPSWYMRICSVLERKQELLRSLQLKKLELPPLRALTSDLLTLSSSSTRWEQYYLSVRGFL